MNDNSAPHTPSALDRFRALVFADDTLRETLDGIEDTARFVESAVGCARAHGIPLTRDEADAALRPDPAGLFRFSAAPANGTLPPPGWLPVHVAVLTSDICIDWAYFGARPLNESFFEDSARRALSRPFNRMFRLRTSLRDLEERGAREPGISPTGFIFHMSRCGSTLLSRMLAADTRNVVVSEAAPIEAIVQLCRASPDVPLDRKARILAAMLAAYGRPRTGRERHFFVKLDSWHTLSLPLFRRAFPSVPWLYLYRDPVEVLVSQMRQRGMQTVPDIIPPSLYGIENADGMRGEEYCARVLEKICGAVLDNFSEGGGIVVNYSELPGALCEKILPHFGIAVDEQSRETMAQAAHRDAKAPDIAFADDRETKQREATETLRTLAERHVDDAYRQLEALRKRPKIVSG